jgi:tRNA(Ile)-lysidine synthetase-like protein
MEIKAPIGKYVLAVSGGVDSMALLHILARQPGVELVVAHFNHNMRDDSGKDEELVRSVAAGYALPYEAAKAEPGELIGEENARRARYAFLEAVQVKYEAGAIITAHHLDDKIETALLNTLRGTGRKGLSAISDNKKIVRPFLNTSKAEIIDYAKKYKLKWREDSTNIDTSYLRNYIRLNIIPGLVEESRINLISKIDKVAKTNQSIDLKIATLSQYLYNNGQIDRQKYSELPNNIGKEFLAFWLRTKNIGDFDRKTIERLSTAIKTAKAGSRQPIKQDLYLEIGQKTALFSNTLHKV